MFAAGAQFAFAMPTKDEIKEAQPLVAELMAPELKALKARTKTSAEVGDAACALAEEAAGEAAKWLLLTGAATYYARDGRCERALETLKAVRGAVKDIPDADLRDVLAAAVRAAPAESAAPLRAAGLEVDGRVRAADGLKKARAALKKTPKDPALHRRAGACLAVLDDWEEALKEFARADEKAAAAAKGEQRKSWPTEKCADFWWDEAEASRGAAQAAYRRHAASLYAEAVGAGALAGLAKTRAERRVAEVEASNPASGLFAAAASALYLVVDLSAGAEAKKYPVTYLAEAPKDGWTDEYKTAKLVLRRIEAGSFIMGEDQKDESHRVTLTKPFYIGVFEVTQKQYELVTGESPSEFKGDMRPVEKVSYDMIRGKGEGAKWPASAAVDPGSFMGKLRARTGLCFDLPTEAQWEYACRAGTKSAYNNGSDKEEALLKLGRFALNQKARGWWESDAAFARHRPDEKGGHSNHHTVVGSYLPNAWGLYDMHGNVWEWCEDLYSAGNSDRVRRGGSWYTGSGSCTAGERFYCNPDYRLNDLGFRLAASQD